MSWLLVKLLVRFVVFGLVFGFATYRSENVTVKPRFGLPLAALVFALLNTAIYWAAKPILSMATLGMLAFALPFILNGVFLYLTGRLMKPMRVQMEIKGILTMLWLAGLLTIAHGLLYVGLDVLAS